MIISRYMPYKRFIDLLANGLYIPNMSKFDEPWEGRFHQKAEYLNERNEIISFNSAIASGSITVNGVEPEPEELPVPLENDPNIDIAKTWCFVSCWHRSEEECAAMCKLYGKDRSAVCVELELSGLIDCAQDYFDDNPDSEVLISKVEYMHPSKADEFTLHPELHLFPKGQQCKSTFATAWVRSNYFSKHIAYGYEKELRLVIDKLVFSTEKNLRKCPYDHLQLKLQKNSIKNIILAPGCGDKFSEKIHEDVKVFDYTFEVKKSCLDLC